MTGAVNLSRRIDFRVWVLAVVFVLGCSTEPATQSNSVKTTQTAPPTITATTASVPWSAATLIDGDFVLEDGFRGLTFDDFQTFFAKPPQTPQATWLAIHDAIVCFGKPRGYLYSKESFAQFTLRLEFRYAPPANESAAKDSDPNRFNPNTGVMLHIHEPHKQWPKSLEVQGRFADMATIKENGGAAKVEVVDDAMARELVRKPVGEWNTLEVVSKAGAVTAFLNGTKVCESQPGDVSSGMIGLQSEDFEVHFRRLRIRPE